MLLQATELDLTFQNLNESNSQASESSWKPRGLSGAVFEPAGEWGGEADVGQAPQGDAS